MLDVLIDMTALNTPSRERGIGRYVQNLCHALAQRAGWDVEVRAAVPALHIAGLTRHRGSADRRTGAIDETLKFTGDSRIRVSSWQYQRHKLERPAVLGRPRAPHRAEALAFAGSARHAAR